MINDENKIGFGSIQIDKKVLADIASSSVNDISGASLIPEDVGNKFLTLFGKKTPAGVTVIIDKDNEVIIELKICVSFGMNIPDIARQVQDAVRTAVEKTTDITLKDVHVIVQGIERGES